MLDALFEMCNRKCFSRDHFRFFILQMLNTIDCGLSSKYMNHLFFHLKKINQTVVDHVGELSKYNI